jgi:O-antigen ligase
VIQGFVAVVLLGALVVNFAPTRQLITDRVATPHSNRGRSILYNESVALALHSPLLGYGGPQTSTVNPNLPPVGTQGQVWTILVSNGIPAAFFFFAYFLSVMWQTRRARSALGLWCHIVVLVALFQSPFYGLLASQIHLVFIAIALAFREASEPDQPHGRVPAARVVERPTPAAGSRDVGRHDGMDLVRP